MCSCYVWCVTERKRKVANGSWGAEDAWTRQSVRVGTPRLEAESQKQKTGSAVTHNTANSCIGLSSVLWHRWQEQHPACKNSLRFFHRFSSWKPQSNCGKNTLLLMLMHAFIGQYICPVWVLGAVSKWVSVLSK